MDEHPPLLAGRYELGEELGRGGMARVVRAFDRRVGRPVAIKVLAEWLAQDPVYLARFHREALAAAALNHPGIVRIFDAGSDGETHFIAMELVEGRTLDERLAAEGPLAPDRAVGIADAVAAALAAAHERDIVHRDVKPANVMLTEGDRVKVTDFGIARAGAASTLTQTGTVFGTARYLAPEQARGERADARADVYSLGVVLYEMLAGRPPFTGESPIAVAMQHVNVTPPPLAGFRPGVSRALDGVVMRALSKDPEDRFPDAGEFRAALRAAAVSPGPAAAAPVPSGTTQPLDVDELAPPRRRLGAALLLSTLGVAAIALLLLLPALLRNEPATDRTERTPATASPSPSPSPDPSPTESPTPSPSPSPSPTETSAEGAIGEAEAALSAIVDEGKDLREIEPKVAADIQKRLRETIRELGDPEKALDKLDELHEKVEEWVEKGEISSGERGEAILAGIERLEDAIGSLGED